MLIIMSFIKKLLLIGLNLSLIMPLVMIQLCSRMKCILNMGLIEKKKKQIIEYLI
ncbi:MAG TPA: hypothetical protein [Caudoviricetes sp.]|nr:MAG TPA: hypothetical protein [Caudoviricetes sp.]